MTDTALATIPLPSQQPRQPARSKRVAGRTKAALDLMVWEGTPDNEAAVKVGITVTAIRLALKLPHVRAYYREQLQVLRERESAANIHALVEVRNQKANQMARVQAVKALEQISDDAPASRGSVSLPGLVIVVNTGTPLTQPPTIDADMKVISE